MKTKFLFVTGGVVSSLGKGLAAASIGALMEARGLKVSMQKMDPYINVDPGTMSPFQHGEVFVTDDGAETDLDLGHYERYTTANLTKKSNFTTGQIYDSVIRKERRGERRKRGVADEEKPRGKPAARGKARSTPKSAPKPGTKPNSGSKSGPKSRPKPGPKR